MVKQGNYGTKIGNFIFSSPTGDPSPLYDFGVTDAILLRGANYGQTSNIVI